MHFPGLFIQETHLFDDSQEVLLKKLKGKIAEPSRENSKNTGKILFNGMLKKHSFIVSQNSTYPQYFIPMVRGEFVEGDNETLLKLEYDLYRGSKLYLFLWTFICLLSAVFFVTILFKPAYSIVSLAIMLLNYIIALGNFRLHSKRSKTLLLEVLNNSVS